MTMQTPSKSISLLNILVATAAVTAGLLHNAGVLTVSFNGSALSTTAPPTAAPQRDVSAHKDCLVVSGTPQLCPSDERMWSESLTHPSILWHPSPRRVLVVGPLGPALVAESLRHFTLSEVVWVSGSSVPSAATTSYFDLDTLPAAGKGNATHNFTYDGVHDVLGRVKVVHDDLAHYLAGLDENAKFDVILADQLTTPDVTAHMDRVSSALAPGGVLSMAVTTENDALLAIAQRFKRVQIGEQHLPAVGKRVLFYYATNTDLHLAHQSMSQEYVNGLIRRRIFDGAEDLDHYDGEMHARLFSLPLGLRKQVRKTVAKGVATSTIDRASVSYAPSRYAAEMEAVSVPGVTLWRDYFGCDEEVLAESDDMLDAIKRGLELSHTKIVTIEDMATDDDADRARIAAAHIDGTPAVGVIVSAVLADGHLTVRTYPSLGYAAAEYTSYTDGTSTAPEEVLGLIGEEMGAKRIAGHAIPRGQLAPSAPATVSHWYHGSDYYMSPKVLGRKSPTAGRGQFAGAAIKKGEIMFQGPIETYLRHEADILAMPKWRQKFIDHMGEQAEDDIWISPPLFDEDPSYWTNHNCNANLVYTSYDTMVARRDIAEGEELTFDYATADSEPRPIFKCNCGAPTCRGEVHGNDWMRDDVVNNYGAEAFWPHIRKKILMHKAGLPVASILDPSYAGLI
ncbi:hypothetical protein BC828DRAFT_381633 [Blastocladiella britannica]|nr:hypothetical protein BC828DRAFT_381633 [Blastocladiella britannica]